MASVEINNELGSSATRDGHLIIKDGLPISSSLQIVADEFNTDTAIQLSTLVLKAQSSEQCPLEVESTGSGGGISLMDNTTTDADSVGIGAFGDALCFRSGNVAAGNMRLLDDGTLTLFGNKLTYFTPNIQSGGAVTIDDTNEDDFCGGVYRVTGAVTITIDDTVSEGFTLTIVQLDANQCTIATTGTITLRNRLSHTGSAGQWATISVIRMSDDLVLSGDTA